MIRAETKAPYVLRKSVVEVIRLDDPAFGGKADGVVNADGSTNYLTATNNSAAILAALTKAVSLKRKLIIPPGNWLYRTPIAFPNANGLWMEGVGEDSNIIYVNPGNVTGLVIGSGTNGVKFMQPESTPLSLATEASPADRRIKIATTAPGEVPTQRFFRGMHIFFSDASQTFPYRVGTGVVSQYLAAFAVVSAVVDDDYIDLDGSPEFTFNAGTKIGYWHNPVTNVHIQGLQFSNDLSVSWRSGGSAMLAVVGTVDPKLYDLTFSRDTSRGLYLTRTKGFDVDLIRSREVARDTQQFNGHNADGTLMSVGDMSGFGEIRRLYMQGGVHGIDFLGGKVSPALHCKVTSVTARDPGGSVIGSHSAARFIDFSDIDIVCNTRAWGEDAPYATNESDAPVLMRGLDVSVTDARVTGSPVAFRSHANSGHAFKSCKSFDCGRGLLVGESTNVNVRDMEHVNARVMGIDMQISYGPTQGLDHSRNMQFDDVRSTGTPPPLGDLNVILGGQYQMNRLKELGWSFERFSRNGKAPVFQSNGTFQPIFPLFAASSSANAVDQFVGPAYSVAPTTSAKSALVDSVASTTSTYQGGDQYPLVGGTATLSNTTLLNIETIKLKSLDLDYAGLGHAPGDVLTLEGGDAITRATYTVGTVDGNGTILTGSITNAGEYRFAPPTFGQLSSTGGGTTSTVTGIGSPPISTSTRHAPGDILTLVNGSPEYILGIPQWPHAEVLTVDAQGRILTAQLVSYDGIAAGGSFEEMSSAGFLDQRASTGLGTSSRFEVTSVAAERATFKNAVYDPVTVRVARAGVYSVAPAGSLAHGVSTNGGVGAGATFTAVYGPVVDASHSPRKKITVPSSGSSTIEGLGPRQGVEYDIVFAGVKTLVNSATLVLPTGADIVTAAGDSCTVWSDKSTPVIYTVSQYTRADGTPLRDYIIDQGAPTALTDGATLTGAQIRTGIIEVNAADNAADNYQLPTGSDMSAHFTEVAIGKAVEFTMLNLNTNAAADATITTNTGWTLRGNMVTESNDADRARSSARFRARKTAASTWTIYRIG